LLQITATGDEPSRQACRGVTGGERAVEGEEGKECVGGQGNVRGSDSPG